MADLKKYWRAEAQGDIWVVPAPDEPRLLVLLPAAGDDGRWWVTFKAPGWKEQEKYSQGGNPATVKFVTFRQIPEPWTVTVCSGDDHTGYFVFETFNAYWPSGDIWALTPDPR